MDFRYRRSGASQARASRANDLQRMSGFVQLVFERRLSQASDFWFDVGLERVSLRRPKAARDRPIHWENG